MTDSFTNQLQNISPGSLAIVGVPYDAQSSYLPGCAKAPDLIIEAYHSPSSNYFTELGYQLEDDMAISFLGNLSISDYFDIEKGIDQVLQAGGRTLSLGGDHSIS